MKTKPTRVGRVGEEFRLEIPTHTPASGDNNTPRRWWTGTT